ncbi:MAG: glycosyltransferase family 4 protein [Acidimicrobiia bacterium]
MRFRKPRVAGLERPASIMVLVASNRRRGAEVFGERLTRGLSELGWMTDFVALQAADTDRIVGADPLRPAGAATRIDVATLRALRRRVHDRRPSILLANGGATLRYAIATSTTMSSPPLVAYASIGEPRFWLRSAKHARLQRFLHRRADVILAVSESTRRQLIDDIGVDAGRVQVAHTGVPHTFFVDSEPSEQPVRLLFLGSLSPEKDPQTALDVTLEILQTNPIRLRIVGDGPLRAGIADQIASRGLGDVIELTGSVDDVTPHLAWADVLVLTSRTEGLPGAILEAGAAGVPCVAFDVGGVAETMRPGVSGVVVPPGDVNAMVTELNRLIESPPKTRNMGVEARDFVANRFTLDQSIQRHHQILSELLTTGVSR